MIEQPESDSDMRRRAAWLLALLAVVAGLVVLLFTTVLDSSGGGGGQDNAGPDDTLVNTSSAPPSTPSTSALSSSSPSSSARNSSSASGSPTDDSSGGVSGDDGPATKSCPGDDTCTLQGDYGKAIDAINDYREKNGQDRVPGSVSKAAQKCAKNNGSGCTGGWAETQLSEIDGKAAVRKIASLGKLLDPDMTSVGVGWAYSPDDKQYYFAIVRKS